MSSTFLVFTILFFLCASDFAKWIAISIKGMACINHGISAEKPSGRNNRASRSRDVGRGNRSDRIGHDLFESDESASDDVMEFDNHFVNPNEY